MSRAKKNDKSDPEDDDAEETAKKAPWAVEIEFFNKPSFMASILEIKADAEHISVIKDDGTLLGFPHEAIRKILVMQTRKTRNELD